LAGIWITSLVWGFTPFLAFLCATLNVPKPTKVTFSPLDKESVTISMKASITLAASFLVILACYLSYKFLFAHPCLCGGK